MTTTQPTRGCVRILSAALLIFLLSPCVGSNALAERKRIDFQEMSFELPHHGWEIAEQTPTRISLIHRYGDRRFQSIGIWSVQVPSALRGLSQQEHASKYLAAERQSWSQGLHGTGQFPMQDFAEGEREISGKKYPVMTFRQSLPDGFLNAGFFLLYFPNDFNARQKFYVFMWSSAHAVDEKGKSQEDVDIFVSSFQVRPPCAQPPYVQLWKESQTLFAQGRRAEAKTAAEKALKLSEEMQGPEHPDVALSLHNLGEFYRMDALFSKDEATRQHAAAVAESMHKRALAIREKTIGLNNSFTISSMISLADDYRLQRRYDEAEPLYKRAIEILKGIGPGASILQDLGERARLGLTQLEESRTK